MWKSTEQLKKEQAVLDATLNKSHQNKLKATWIDWLRLLILLIVEIAAFLSPSPKNTAYMLYSNFSSVSFARRLPFDSFTSPTPCGFVRTQFDNPCSSEIVIF